MRQSNSRTRRIYGFPAALLITALWLAFMPVSRSQAQMIEMADAELAAMYATGFSSFTLEDGLARMSLSMTMSTYTEIAAQRMGYYNDGTTTAWDNDWQNVSLGTPTTDLVFKGVFIETKFSNITDPATRRLEYLRIGTPDLTGAISALFNSFSGTIGGAGVDGHRINLGPVTITADHTGFYISLEQSGPQQGYWFHWDSATKTP